MGARGSAQDQNLYITRHVVPLPIVLLHLTVWGAWTAALRPLSGDSVWERVEWKMATETLLMTSGSLPFEWMEPAGSYMAPVALYYHVVAQKVRH